MNAFEHAHQIQAVKMGETDRVYSRRNRGRQLLVLVIAMAVFIWFVQQTDMQNFPGVCFATIASLVAWGLSAAAFHKDRR